MLVLPIEAGAPDALIAQADATERSLGMRAPPLVVPPPREDLVAHLRWYDTPGHDAFRRLQRAQCRECSEREQAVYVALLAIEQDHLMGQLLAPTLRDPAGEPVSVETAAQFRRRLAAFVTAASSTPMGAALFALDVCARRSSAASLERVHAFCSERLRFWARIAGQANEDVAELETTPDAPESVPPEN